MATPSFNEALCFDEKRIVTTLLLESPFTKEIRILLKKGQSMKEHKTPFAIVVHVLEGEIDFAAEGAVNTLRQGEIIALEGNILHNLTANKDSIIRLTLSKLDTAERVQKVAESATK